MISKTKSRPIEVTTQMLIDAGVNAFALQLLSESLAGKKDIQTFAAIRFQYRGVIYTFEPARREYAPLDPVEG